LANFQAKTVEWTSKPWASPSNKYINATFLQARYNVSEEERSAFSEICKTQLIHSSELVQNFSVLATTLAIFFAGGCIILNLILPWLMTYLRAHAWSKSETARVREMARDADDKYQLLRMALEGSHFNKWELGAFGLPVTKKAIGVSNPIMINGFIGYPNRVRTGLSSFDSADSQTHLSPSHSSDAGQDTRTKRVLELSSPTSTLSDDIHAAFEQRRKTSLWSDVTAVSMSPIRGPMERPETNLPPV
jgi:hypothetical protein